MAMKPCTKCKGTGVVQAVGAWVTVYDTEPCPNCGGTGEEPETDEPQEDESDNITGGEW